jgi:DnaJ-domain-containing protein 1
MKDYYQILEVHRKSSVTEIKLSFRKLIKEYHPDVNNNSNDFTEIIQDINEAYGVLKDSAKRNSYNLIYDKQYKNAESREQKQSQKQEYKNLNEYLWNGLNTEKYKPYDNEGFDEFENRVISSLKKDEFETTVEFERRIQEIESELLNSYLGNQKITMKYNADNPSFSVWINGLIFEVSIPIDIAPEFKNNAKSFIIRCSKDLKIIDITTEFKGIKYVGNNFKDDWILNRNIEKIKKIESARKVDIIASNMIVLLFFLLFLSFLLK